MVLSEGSSEIEGARKRLAAAKTQSSLASQNIKNFLAQQKIMMDSLKASSDAAVKEVEEAQTALTNAEKKWEVIDIDQETTSQNNEPNEKRRKISLSPQGNTNSSTASSSTSIISSSKDIATIEIDLLEKQINSEYDALTALLQDNAYVLAEQEETFVVSLVTKEDPIAPIGVLLNNVRNKQLKAIKDTDRLQSDVTLLKGHTERYAILEAKKKQLLGTDGGVQKIKSVVRAILRIDKDHVNIDTLNEDSQPAVILKWLGAQLKQFSAYDEKPEDISKIIRRLKKMAKTELACPCCTREFASEHEINTFQARMTELADPDVSELHAKATEKAGDVRKVLDRYEKYKKTVSENMHEHIEYLRVIEELTEVKAIIAGLKNKEKALSDTKERVNKLNSLLMSAHVLEEKSKQLWKKIVSIEESRTVLN